MFHWEEIVLISKFLLKRRLNLCYNIQLQVLKKIKKPLICWLEMLKTWCNLWKKQWELQNLHPLKYVLMQEYVYDGYDANLGIITRWVKVFYPNCNKIIIYLDFTSQFSRYKLEFSRYKLEFSTYKLCLYIFVGCPYWILT